MRRATSSVALISDTLRPVNGVGVLVGRLAAELRARGWAVRHDLDGEPDRVHVFTDGPVAQAAVAALARRGLRWTQSYHTDWFALIRATEGRVEGGVLDLLRRHYRGAVKLLVATPRLRERLFADRLHDRIELWQRGVDTALFNPGGGPLARADTELLYVGRVSREKNIEAFLDLDLGRPQRKIVVGDGPDLDHLRQRYAGRGVRFVGHVAQAGLPEFYRRAAVLVFPSSFDTLGTVLMEAACCGCPAAGYPVQGAADVIVPGATGYCDADLAQAVRGALGLERAAVAREAERRFAWPASVEAFAAALVPGRAAAAGRRVTTMSCQGNPLCAGAGN
jgi:glycosyltransferase involved in cell wall biosynthesis